MLIFAIQKVGTRELYRHLAEMVARLPGKTMTPALVVNGVVSPVANGTANGSASMNGAAAHKP
jgi:hypothetical protein